MHPTRDCPEWEYENDPRHGNILKGKISAFLVRLRLGGYVAEADIVDTRPIHSEFFSNLTPPFCHYYAGHYRGESYRCLRNYPVGVGNDKRVGYPPYIVESCMHQLEEEIRRGVRALDSSKNAVSLSEHIINSVRLTCSVLNQLFLIHPYANGNGHMGRVTVWMMLSRYGYYPVKLDVARNPGYSQSLMEYRDGNRAPLEALTLSWIQPSN